MAATADLLQLIRFRVSIFHNAKICGNWRISEHSEGSTCFHLVTMGNCHLDIPGQEPHHLVAGDLLVFPREMAHQMTPEESLSGSQEHLPYEQAAGRKGTGLLCAEVNFRHSAASYLLDGLPPVLIIRGHQADWLPPLRKMILQESSGERFVAEAVLERLCELIFVYALTHYLSGKPEQAGLLALYSHPRLSRALNALHERPDHDWSLEEMAGSAAMSRTAFARAFRETGGWTPMQYLNWWRLQQASDLLGEGQSVARAAESVGFHSQAAFSRAFRQCFGLSPSVYRNQLRIGSADSA
ncbi:MAG: AraC family transcriptional regulator [Pseudohongiellaceae bacterium]